MLGIQQEVFFSGTQGVWSASDAVSNEYKVWGLYTRFLTLPQFIGGDEEIDNSKRLAQVNEDINKLLTEKKKTEKELDQLKNQEKKIRRKKSIEERKKRNHRLIQRGAILESYIDKADEKTNEEIQVILDKVFLNLD